MHETVSFPSCDEILRGSGKPLSYIFQCVVASAISPSCEQADRLTDLSTNHSTRVRRRKSKRLRKCKGGAERGQVTFSPFSRVSFTYSYADERHVGSGLITNAYANEKFAAGIAKPTVVHSIFGTFFLAISDDFHAL